MKRRSSEQSKNSEGKVHHYWAWIYGILLTAYAVFTLLQVFAIPHDTVKVDESQVASIYQTEGLKKAQITEEGTSGNTEKAEVTDNADKRETTVATDSTEATPANQTYNYQDNYISINLTGSYINNTMVYVADIQLKNLGLLKSGLANDSFGRNVTETTSDMAERLDAILAVNGDFYGFRDTGYVIRNGVLYRSEKKSDDAQDLVLWSDGTMEVIREGNITAEELLERGALQVYSFGPGLVEDGEITVNASSEVGQAMLSNPRTAIGMIEPMHYEMVVSDGRTTESEGLSLLQLAQIMQDLGCTTAYNLDGGGSTTMYFNGEVINNPTSGRKSSSERSVSDIVYIGY
ncbi:MAG: phosphodiester glycosidase family protein [Eubacterium sp.]|nr:phosphodiester glycosidase family protein [Eubacterium sp.]